MITGETSVLAERFASVRRTTDRLCEGLSAEDCQLQSMDDASPVKWHLAHTTWFFETFVLGQCLGQQPLNEAYRVLFNSYYVGVGERHPRAQRGLLSRPSLQEVLDYRRHVELRMLDALAQPRDARTLSLVELGLHHEQQHQELILTDLKHHLHCNPLGPAYRATPHEAARAEPAPLRYVPFEGGLHEVGHADLGTFAFDNESPRHRAWLEPFELADRLVTAGEFISFIEDGGYRRPELWLSDGWDTCRKHGWRAPLYWREDAPGRWRHFTLQGWRDVAAHAPVCHVSHFEADAYARWAGASLPTEAEWEVAAQRHFKANTAGALLEDECLHPMPAPPATQGMRQMKGDCWEWTASAYLPYPGFKAAEGAVGEYNGKFMSGQMVLRGGSCATPGSHVRVSYRNFFPPAARWQFSGIRLAR